MGTEVEVVSDVVASHYDRRPAALGALAVLPDELLNGIITRLPVRDITSLACVSSVLNVFCSEEPLWMHLCMEEQQDELLEYTTSWRHSALSRLAKEKGVPLPELKPPLRFDGFSSMFLYRRWYRCHVALEGFAADQGLIARQAGVSPEEFSTLYDGRMPVMLTDLADSWRAKSGWTMEALVERCGDAALRVTVSHGKPVKMRVRDYAHYLEQQHDEEPLYVFDEDFGTAAPMLLEDYSVPPHFAEDLLEVLGPRRPPYRWLIMGPARSGASWHVDPALTSAWNTLLVGRKRWGIYPPGKVPPGVTMHIDEDSGDVHYQCGTSLEWWLEVYPFLPPDERPLECTQLAGETIFMPSGWWHIVLNLEPTIAVTQNFVNTHNFETVCLDMAPGFRHRGIARAGQLALTETAKYDRERAKEFAEEMKQRKGLKKGKGGEQEGEDGEDTDSEWEEWDEEADGEYAEEDETEARPQEEGLNGTNANHNLEQIGGMEGPNGSVAAGECGEPRVEIAWWADVQAMKGQDVKNGLQGQLSAQAAEEYEKHGASNGEVAALEIREWLRSLWEARPDLQERTWQGACLALDTATWLERLTAICQQCSLPEPQGVERFPVGSGHNLVYLVGGYAIKVYVDGVGGDYAMRTLGRELELYHQITAANSPLKTFIPELVASGIVIPTETSISYQAVPWDGNGPEPDFKQASKKVPAGKKSGPENGTSTANGREADAAGQEESARRRRRQRRGVFVGGWRGRRDHRERKAQEEDSQERWPYLITKRCEGEDLKSLYEKLTPGDFAVLTSFLGEALTNLHTLPLPEGDRLKAFLWDPEDEEQPVKGDENSSAPAGAVQKPVSGSKKISATTVNGRPLEARSEGSFQEASGMEKNANGHVVDGSEAVPEGGDVAPGESSKEAEGPNGEAALVPVPEVWAAFIKLLRSHRQEIVELLDAYDFIPRHLLPLVDAYLPKDPAVLVASQLAGSDWSWPQPAWLHTDPMDDNILLLPIQDGSVSANHEAPAQRVPDASPGSARWPASALPAGRAASMNGQKRSVLETDQSRASIPDSSGHMSVDQDEEDEMVNDCGGKPTNGVHIQANSGVPAGNGSLTKDLPGGRMWEPSCLLDFQGVSVGDPLYDLACLHLTSFRCNPDHLRSFLQSYKVPLGTVPVGGSQAGEPGHPGGPGGGTTACESKIDDMASTTNGPEAKGGGTSGKAVEESRISRLSYRAMCYCILHEHASVRYIFKNRPDLAAATTLEEVEETVWGALNEMGRVP